MPRLFLIVLGAFLLVVSVLTASPSAPPVPLAAQASSHFDAKTATDAWLATVSGPDRARSDAYFEGGYWLILWDFLYGSVVLVVILATRFSVSMRDLALRITRFSFLQDWLYAAFFNVVTFVFALPLTIWESFFREHNYGLSNQSFVAWFRDQLVSVAILILLGGIVIAVLFSIVRRLPRTWHIWGTLVSVVFIALAVAVTPVFIAPLFNTYKPLQNPAIKAEILALAHANGIPAQDVYEVDASRQSKRVSANVSGLLGTERITLNDNLLARCSPQSVLATMGHEMGHYVLHHIDNAIIFFSLVGIIFFGILRWALNWLLTRWGERWGIRDINDIAVLPVAFLVISVFGFLFTPINNSFTRTQEYEADLYGINASRQPDGEAEVDLLLGEYRKLDPQPLEEFLFFDHPSGRTRIYAAMRWKAENLCIFDPALPCKAQPTGK